VIDNRPSPRQDGVGIACRREECDRIHAEIPDRDYEWYLRAV
jgi:hypothetical protein